MKTELKWLPISEWDEEMGDCLWTMLPVREPYYVGHPFESTWIEGYYTHFIEISFLNDLLNVGGMPNGSSLFISNNADPWLPISEAPKPDFNDPIVHVIRWWNKIEKPVEVFWCPIDQAWVIHCNGHRIPEEEFTPHFMYLPSKPKM